MAGFRKLSVNSVEKLSQTENAVILDLRDHVDYRCGHIPNAINLGEHNLYLILGNFNRQLPLIFYGDNRENARKMARLFADFGFERCYYLENGYEEWLAHQETQNKLPLSLLNWMQAHGFDGNDLNQRGFNGETPIMSAARQGNLEHVIDLIDFNAGIDLCNNDGNSAVWLACYSNSFGVLLALVEAGANLDIQNVNGATPLIYAASAGRCGMVQLLLQSGANKDLTTLDGFSALDVASTLPILKLLRYVDKGGPLAREPMSYLKAS